MRQHAVFLSQGESGLPAEYRKTRKDRPSHVYKILADAYNSEQGRERLDAVGKAMQSWGGPGAHDGLNFDRLKRHRAEVKGRWEVPEVLFGVAAILKNHSSLSKVQTPQAPRDQRGSRGPPGVVGGDRGAARRQGESTVTDLRDGGGEGPAQEGAEEEDGRARGQLEAPQGQEPC
eukprot:5251903-Prymnesium_polylepis.1